MSHSRTDLIPVQGSEVMRRCNIDLQTWRNATDTERESWRKQARAQISAEIAGQPKPGQEGYAIVLEAISKTDSRVTSLDSRIAQLESENIARSAEISNLGNRLNSLESAVNQLIPRGKHQ